MIVNIDLDTITLETLNNSDRLLSINAESNALISYSLLYTDFDKVKNLDAVIILLPNNKNIEEYLIGNKSIIGINFNYNYAMLETNLGIETGWDCIELKKVGDERHIRGGSTYRLLSSVTSIDDSIIGNGKLDKKFRWSKDNISFSSWLLFSDISVLPITEFKEQDEIYVEYNYRLLSGGPVCIKYVYVNAKYNSSSLTLPSQNNIVDPLEQLQKQFNKNQSTIYDPYKYRNAQIVQARYSYMVNQIFGHEVRWIRATPDEKSVDYLLKENTIFYGDQSTCIKIIVPNNQFPDNKINFGPFGLDFEIPFEIQIDKNSFEAAFGKNTGPQKRDVVLFSLMDRIYEVSSSTLFKDFFAIPLYWKVSLVKYAPKYNRILSPQTEEDINSITKQTEELFGKELEVEKDNVTNKQQYKEKGYHTDPTRNKIDRTLPIVEEELYVDNTKISDYYYDLHTVFRKEENHSEVIEYKFKHSLGNDDSTSYSSWFREPTYKSHNPKAIDIEFSDSTINLKYNINLFNMYPMYKVGKWILIKAKNAPTKLKDLALPAKIISMTQFTIQAEVEPTIFNDTNQEFPGWQNHGYYDTSLEQPSIFMSSVEGINGMYIDMLASKWIRVVQSNKNTYIKLQKRLDKDTWYGICTNIINPTNEINMSIWTRRSKIEGKDSVKRLFTKKVNLPEKITWEIETTPKLLASDLHLRNIRLMKKSLSQYDQIRFFMEETVINAGEAIIIDNAIPTYRPPYIGATK